VNDRSEAPQQSYQFVNASATRTPRPETNSQAMLLFAVPRGKGNAERLFRWGRRRGQRIIGNFLRQIVQPANINY
jgi:hypothetical protein